VAERSLPELLQELNGVAPKDVLRLLLQRLGGPVRGTGVRLLVADVEERVLNVWGEAGEPHGPRVGSVLIEGSEQGAVYRTGRPRRFELPDGTAVIAPVTARGERIGVVELATEPGDDDEGAAVTAGLLLGQFVTAADRWTDDFHVARRRQDMSLAAEVQWNTLPLAAFTADGLTLAGALEPAYDIGGDAFDYAYGREALSVGIFDAMGHGLAAARVSSLVVSAFRNARRRGEGLQAQARFIDGAVRDLVDWRGFVTGQLLRLDLADPSRTVMINAGHPAPFVQRGPGLPERLGLVAHHPFGIPFPNPLGEQLVPLAAGDRLVLFSDGLVEARPDGGEAYGEARLATTLDEMRGQSSRETARRLITDVRNHRAADLADDATVVIVDIPS
jgi:hypothetical protein